MSLLTFNPELTDPESNLAAAYFSADRQFLGTGGNCDSLDRELTLSGLDMLDDLALPRFLWGATWAPMLVAGLHGYGRSHSLIGAALWTLAGYIAPLPAVAIAAYEQGVGKPIIAPVFGY